MDDKKPYDQYHPLQRKFAEFSLALIIILGLYILFIYYRERRIQDEEFLIRQKSAEHVLIDKIGDSKIYLVIYKGDTVGVVAEK